MGGGLASFQLQPLLGCWPRWSECTKGSWENPQEPGATVAHRSSQPLPSLKESKPQCGFTLGRSLLIHAVVSAWGFSIWPWEKQSNLNLPGQHLHKMAARDPQPTSGYYGNRKAAPTNAEGRGLESEAWEVALDHSDSLCPGFLLHLRRSGPPAAHVGRCPAGEWSRC